MHGDAGELRIQLRLHERRWWLLAPLELGDHTLWMVVDTGSPVSAISAGSYGLLASTEHVVPAGQNTYRLRSPVIQGQPIPDLQVRISSRVTQVGADGVLGLDFLARFTDVYFHVPSLRLTLR